MATGVDLGGTGLQELSGSIQKETSSPMKTPIFILVEPQLPENIGAVARAMGNFGLHHLRVVNPHVSVVDEKAIATAAGAEKILHGAQLYPTVDAALADITHVYGTCATQRHMVKSYVPLRQAMGEIAEHVQSEGKVAILFGPERTGLHNVDQVKCRQIIQIPADPSFSSLNLAQATVLVAYEWLHSYHQQLKTSPLSMTCEAGLHRGETQPATQAEIQFLLQDLETRLDDIKFWRIAHKKPLMWQNVQNIFTRCDLTTQEVRTLRGMIRMLYNFNP